MPLVVLTSCSESETSSGVSAKSVSQKPTEGEVVRTSSADQPAIRKLEGQTAPCDFRYDWNNKTYTYIRLPKHKALYLPRAGGTRGYAAWAKNTRTSAKVAALKGCMSFYNVNKCVVHDINNSPCKKKVGASGKLRVIEPSGGEKWTVGTKYALRWDRGDAGTYVRIQLTKGNRHYKWISKRTRNDGRYTWKILSSIAVGSQFKVKIKSVKKKKVFDASNRYFTIKNKETGGVGGGGGDYTYLNKHNAYLLDGHTIRWESKNIQVSGATGNWKSAVNRWPTVRFRHVGSPPSSGNGIEIIGYASMAACGTATHANWNDGRMAYCQVRIASDHSGKGCDSEAKTMTHEIGHCIGVFKHTADGGLMDATSASSDQITAPIRNMISLLYSLSPGTNINPQLNRSSLSVQRSKDNKYDPAGRRLYTYTTYFMENDEAITVQHW